MGKLYTMATLFLRRVREQTDMLLLQHIYATSRDYEMAAYGFTEPFLTRFLTEQFLIQHRQYMTAPNAAFSIVEDVSGSPLGRFYKRQMSCPEIRVMDIAILPAHRGHGIGTALFEQTMAEAADQGKRVSIHVERLNPAHGFYEQLGFGYVRVDGIYDLMVWPAAKVQAAKRDREADIEALKALAAEAAGKRGLGPAPL